MVDRPRKGLVSDGGCLIAIIAMVIFWVVICKWNDLYNAIMHLIDR